MNKIDLLAGDGGLDGGAADRALELIPLDENERPVMLITSVPQSVKLHYLDGLGFVHCNSIGCVACMAGRKIDKKLLLPVFDPLAHVVAVLPINAVMRPHALRPQITNLLTAPKPAVTLITNLGMGKFRVESRPLPADADAGEAQIAAFIKKYDADEIDLDSLYATVTNDELREDPHIKAHLKLKGLDGANG